VRCCSWWQDTEGAKFWLAVLNDLHRRGVADVLIACVEVREDRSVRTRACYLAVGVYDVTAGQFVYNWQTPKTSGKCYQVTMTTQDGSSVVAKFKTK